MSGRWFSVNDFVARSPTCIGGVLMTRVMSAGPNNFNFHFNSKYCCQENFGTSTSLASRKVIRCQLNKANQQSFWHVCTKDLPLEV